MLQVKNIHKQYKTGELVQDALHDVSLNLRDNEFVAVLGPSGSGKTTLLNTIGGLDRYDSGDLIINGISTKQYKDRDWDAYRNHTIGFVFQSYILIPHQTILANVELALTISGVSRAERRKRAQAALEEVGLGEQSHKRPNQLSGGQMQRVAIARALVNDPDVLLADEPTGALDSETSVQVMELLKAVAKDRLVVMVTHNPELAEQYATRIVKLRDGKITDDSDPYVVDDAALQAPEHRTMGRASMNFLTSLSLSFNNLRTKKGRTLLTAFAGSIGIIGIALILSLSTGVNQYITDIQKETMTSYPLMITAETFDMASLMELQGAMGAVQGGAEETADQNATGVHADHRQLEMQESLESSVTENDLTAFKNYLDDPDSEIAQYLGENGVVYTYNVQFDVFARDADGNIVNTSMDVDEAAESAEESDFSAMMNQNMQNAMTMMTGSDGGAENFEEMMVGVDSTISPVVTDSYDLLYGAWPEAYNEVVLVLDEQNSIPTDTLYQLGLLTGDEYEEIRTQIEDGEEPEAFEWDYADACDRTFWLVPACDRYTENEDGTFTYIEEENGGAEQLIEDALELKVVGVIRPKADAANAPLRAPLAYTSKLTDYVIEHTNDSAVIRAQEETPEINVLNGVGFEAADDEKKAEDAAAYISKLGVSEKASLYTMILYYNAQEADGAETEQQAQTAQASQAGAAAQMDESQMAAALDAWLENTPDQEILVSLYDEYIGGASYEDNMQAFGKVSYDAPDSISIYTDSFENKEAVADCIENYNATVDEDSRITYTDYVALLTSSITSIVDVISYVLIAFVAVSLIVSCIMIGIITHISVLERTKEIGILRALGASKRNISQVFNAETFIIGFCAGLIGVGISVLLTFPINSIIAHLVGTDSVRAVLPAGAAVILIVISMLITIVGGLLPAKRAATKDPVTALRTE